MDLVFGLPLHPLVVHVPVVVLPLSILALIAMIAVPRWRPVLGWPVLIGLALGAATALIAKLSGEALAERVGEPVRHASLGNLLIIGAVVLVLVVALWRPWWRRPREGRRPNRVAGTVIGAVAGILGIAVLVLTVLTGHSGAAAAWSDIVQPRGQATQQPQEPTATSAPATPDATASDDADRTFTLADVQQHADASSCWAAINDRVYDLTAWIAVHPGGSERILAICGTDATATFEQQHSGQQGPEARLASFEIGRLGG